MDHLNIFVILPIISVVSAYLLVAMAEHRMHHFNYQFLMVAGGEELIPGLMSKYYKFIYLCLVVAVLERIFFRDGTSDVPELKFLGSFLLFTGFVLRQWSIRTLGRLWSKRCVFIPGMPHIKSGPYRFMANPEYLSRLIDGVGLCLVLGATWTLLPYVFLVTVLSYRITKIESRQIREVGISEPLPGSTLRSP